MIGLHLSPRHVSSWEDLYDHARINRLRVPLFWLDLVHL